ncbi:MAG: nitrous oxide reductase accessory protein NosL [Nitrospirota bacterium]
MLNEIVMWDRSLKVIDAFILIVCMMVLLSGTVLTAGAANQRRDCHVCGMWIDQYEHTRHVVVLKDGRTEHFCSFACASKYIRDNGESIKAAKVADFITKQLVDADGAYYLEGSDVPAVMSYISIIAFSTKSSAAVFREEHGGHIITFAEALNNL